ncbi:MAG: hypothetical protein NC124_09970 [Clostridium sp.]|nr:hypothetical protein [Clostridium sp.]
MKTMYIALKMIGKQKFMYLVLFLSIICSVYYLVPAYTQVLHYIKTINTLDLFDTENAYYLYRSPFYGWNSGELTEMISQDIQDSDYISACAEYYYLPTELSSYSVMAYNQELIRRFTPQLKEGAWLNILPQTVNVPVVVGSKTGLSYGEVFNLSVSTGEQSGEICCQVVGVLANDCGTVIFSGNASDNFFTSDILIGESVNVIIMPVTDEVLKVLGTNAYRMCSKGKILYTSGQVGLETVKQDFGYAGNIVDLEKGSKQFDTQSKAIVSAMGACWGIYFVITLFVLTCSNLILNVWLNKIYTIYHLLGMSMAERKKIEWTRIGLLIFISSIVTLLFLSYSGLWVNDMEIKYRLLSGCAVVAYISAVYIPVSLWFVRKGRLRC